MSNTVTNEKAVEVLNDLLEKNYDAEVGYKEAAENAKSSALTSFCRDYAGQRYEFGHQIKSEIRQLGGDPEKGTSVLSGVHRTWMNVKQALSSNKDETVVEECIRGEKNAVEEYQEALSSSELPATTREIISQQQQKIQTALNQLQQIEGQLHA